MNQLTRAIVVAVTAWLVCLPAQAREVAGVTLAEQAAVGDVPLQLNGAGVRRKFFIKVYVGALYLPDTATTTAAVLAQDGPRRMAMHILYSEISSQKLVDGWNDGFSANLSATQLRELQPRIDQFNALFDTVNAGDVVQLDYLPGTGTTVTINGDVKGSVPGRDFNDALLRIWLGEEPADNGLKKAMLGAD